MAGDTTLMPKKDYVPDYWGIGKSVSRGFGTVKRIDRNAELGNVLKPTGAMRSAE